MKWPDAIPWIIAVCGWFAAHIFSEARDRRKDFKVQLEKVYDGLISIEKSAITFHTNEKFDPALARELNARLDRIERAISRVHILSSDSLESLIIDHRRSITLENFDSSNFKQQEPNGELIQEITNATLEIEDEIERQYQQQYPASFPYFRWPGIKKIFHFWR